MRRASHRQGLARSLADDAARAATTSAREAAVAESAAGRAATLEARGVAVTSEAAALARYRELVKDELTKATASTLCQWMGQYMAYGTFPSQADFESALVDTLTSTAQSLSLAPNAVWMTSYVNTANGWTQQIASASDPTPWSPT